VTSAEQAAEAERIARRIDDVEGVVNQLMIGTDGSPGYRVAPRE
jgi:osmotically-inducible protein OsmY